MSSHSVNGCVPATAARSSSGSSSRARSPRSSSSWARPPATVACGVGAQLERRAVRLGCCACEASSPVEARRAPRRRGGQRPVARLEQHHLLLDADRPRRTPRRATSATRRQVVRHVGGHQRTGVGGRRDRANRAARHALGVWRGPRLRGHRSPPGRRGRLRPSVDRRSARRGVREAPPGPGSGGLDESLEQRQLLGVGDERLGVPLHAEHEARRPASSIASMRPSGDHATARRP